MQVINKISNLQYELPKLNANNIAEEDLIEIKKMLAAYFANKLDSSFDTFYESESLNPDILQSLANEHNRVSIL